MVDPTKVKPRFFMSLLSASDTGLVAGTCFMFRHRFWTGLPSMKLQM
jgi:hypothetical protein